MMKFMNASIAKAPGMNRRRFLSVTALGSAGFVVGCGQRVPEAADVAADASGDAPLATQTDFNAFVRIGSDDLVTVIVKHLDKGQGVTTGLPTIVAEELDASWSQMRFEFAPADVTRYANTLFGVQGTGGSTAIANSWAQLRTAAAAARAMLVAAAAESWLVDQSEISVSGGQIRHEASGRSAGFGEFAELAATQVPPESPALKSPEQFSLIGTVLPRMDSPEKTDGTARYTIDVERPGMRVAVVAHPPRFGATVGGFDAGAARAVQGVIDVVEIARGIAVVADSFWAAKKGRDALVVTWDERDAETRGSDEILAEFKALAEGEGSVARDDGDAGGALAAASQVIEHTFTLPFLAHATMETMDCVVELADDRCDIWTGSQLQTVDQQVAAAITGLPLGQVHVHTQFAGGSFGRRAVPDSDYVAEAVSIAKATGGAYPVKLIWTREDDFAAGRYRPMSYHKVRAGIDEAGRPIGWQHRVVTQSFLVGTPFEGLIRDGVDSSSVEGAATLPYAVPNITVDLHSPRVGVPTLWWRSVGHTHNALVTEVIIDQLARLAGQDPVAYRLDLLADHPRHAAVLSLAADKADWGKPLADGHFHGVALHESFSSYVAQVAEISIKENGDLRVHKVTCAVDCGIAINPDVIRAQMEGAIGMGLSAFLREAVHIDKGAAREQNFHQYRPLRIAEMPAVDVHIVPSGESPTGVGEPGLPPIAPAVTNAIAAATGRVITELPLANQLRA